MAGFWAMASVIGADNRKKSGVHGRYCHNLSDDGYVFGFEEASEATYLFIIDRLPGENDGDSVQLLIDNSPVGSYHVVKTHTDGEIYSLRAEIPATDVDNVLKLLEVGGDVKVVSDEATYTASLEGMTAALINAHACMTEAGALGNTN